MGIYHYLYYLYCYGDSTRDYKPIKDYLNATKQSINPVILIIILYKPLHPLFQVN
jgi:hypothetical protein